MNVPSNEKIESLVARYIEAHPGFEFHPPENYNHMSVLALHDDVKIWIVDKLGGPLPYWQLMLSAAKEWFPEKNKTKLGHLFCSRFEGEANTFWNGRKEFEPLSEDYLTWRGIHRSA